MVRFKNRYIVLEVDPTKPSKQKLQLKANALQEAILKKVEQLHGDFGVAAVRAGLTTKYCNEHTRTAFVRVRHGPHQLVFSAIPLVTRLENTDVILKSLYTGATLLHCSKFLKKYHINTLKRLLPKVQTEEEKEFLKNAYSHLKIPVPGVVATTTTTATTSKNKK